MDKKLINDIDCFISENSEELFRDIARLVAVNSVCGAAEDGAPFGAGPAKALSVALDIAERMGLETRNCENMLGYAQLGEGDRYLATITHLDVVPTGDGWSHDPFTMVERDGYIIGRGVIDDKGPSALCLYALKYLKERGVKLRYPVRALLGINEETEMRDVEHYVKNYAPPIFCFSPDAGFPLCNGEKGIAHGRISSTQPAKAVVDICGGIAANAVPDKAEAWVRAGKLESRGRVTASEERGLWHLTAVGVGGHASEPKNTVNAIGELIKYILDNAVVSDGEERFFRLLSLLHESSDGSAIGVAADDGLFEPLTIVGSMISVRDGHVVQTFDTRYPTNTDAAAIAAAISRAGGDLAEVTVDRDAPPFYIGVDDPAIRTCINVYNEVTGEGAKPFTMGGGTYARELPNAVSFGPEHRNSTRPDFAGPMHGVDEAASMEELRQALKIYILALLELEKQEL